MKFEDLSPQDKEFIRATYLDKELTWDARLKILTDKFDKSERHVRRWARQLNLTAPKKTESDHIRQGKLKRYDLSKKVFFITAAQNATPVNEPLWKNILSYAKFRKAEVGVLQLRYKNATSIWTENNENDEWWDKCFSVEEDGLITFSYLDGSRNSIHKNLDILGDVRVQPTAVNPLTNFEGVSGHRSSIIGHPRVHFKTLPTLNGHAPKYLLSTGVCTVPNYTESRSGKVAEFHHTYGFIIVEIEDIDTFYIRQVTADEDGNFTDILHRVEDEKVSKIKTSAAFIMGDIHAANVEEKIVEETTRYFKKVQPERVILHDVFDGESVNHHEAKDPIKSYHRLQNGKNLVKKEINGLIDFIDRHKLTKYNPVIVRSNHDMWLDKWIKEGDWKKDVANSIEYMQYSLVLLENKAPKGLLPYLLEQQYGDKITCLDIDTSFTVLDWELGNHGHLGANGSKGNIRQHRKLNIKSVTGDCHSPAREDGAITVGTYSKKRLGYNNGASSWGWAGNVIHNDAKSQLIVFAPNGKFTTLF